MPVRSGRQASGDGRRTGDKRAMSWLAGRQAGARTGRWEGGWVVVRACVSRCRRALALAWASALALALALALHACVARVCCMRAGARAGEHA